MRSRYPSHGEGFTVNQNPEFLKLTGQLAALQLRKGVRDVDRQVIDWLLEENQPAVRYFTLIDLLGHSGSDPEVKKASSGIAKKGWAFDILSLQKPDGRWQSKPRGSL